jgi:Histidine kinase-like ATPase domain
MTQSATARFEPEPRSAVESRRFVVARVHGWDLHRFEDDAALCASELSANAILHSRTAFTVSVRTISGGLRIDVHDGHPDRLPAEVPEEIDPLDTGTTGRGLRLVSTLAARWGYFTTDVAKTVWVELADWSHHQSTEPVVEVARRGGQEGPLVSIVGLPVRAAVASGVQIDDMVRRLQLDPSHVAEDELVTFYKLLDRSAGPRLIGRQEAFRAAGRHQERYSFRLPIAPDEYASLLELVGFLDELRARWADEMDDVPDEVQAMRVWLAGEVAAQLDGRPPTACPV